MELVTEISTGLNLRVSGFVLLPGVRGLFSGRFRQVPELLVAAPGFLVQGAVRTDMRYFSKELPDAPILVRGHPLKFDVLETSDSALISELENCIRRHQGGIVEITAEKYAEELKKKELEKQSGFNSKPRHQRQELSALQFGNPGAAAASRFARPQVPALNPERAEVSHPMPDPIEVPTASSFALPPTARVKDLKEMAERARPK